jgi:hypothetical protein
MNLKSAIRCSLLFLNLGLVDATKRHLRHHDPSRTSSGNPFSPAAPETTGTPGEPSNPGGTSMIAPGGPSEPGTGMIYPYPPYLPPGPPIPIKDPLEEPDTGMDDPSTIVIDEPYPEEPSNPGTGTIVIGEPSDPDTISISPYPAYPPGEEPDTGMEDPSTVVIDNPNPIPPRPSIGEALEEPGSGESTGMDSSTIVIPIEAIEAPAGMEP